MSKYFRAEQELAPTTRELIYDHHGHLLTAKFGYLFQDKAPKTKGKLQIASVCLFPAKFQAFFPDAEPDYLLTVSADIWNRATAAQRLAILDHELCHCWGEEDDETGEMVWSVVGHDVEEFISVIRRHGIWQKELELARQAFVCASPLPVGAPDFFWAPPKEPKGPQGLSASRRQMDLVDEVEKRSKDLRHADEARLDRLEKKFEDLPPAEQQRVVELAEKITTGGPLVQAVAQQYLNEHTPKDQGITTTISGAGKSVTLSAKQFDRLEETLAPTPLDVDCSRCGVVAGEPCRSLTRGKGQGKPLADGTYHDERIEALAPAEPTSESWGDEIEDDEEVG